MNRNIFLGGKQKYLSEEKLDKKVQGWLWCGVKQRQRKSTIQNKNMYCTNQTNCRIMLSKRPVPS